MVTQHGRAMADHVQTWCHGLRLAGVSRPAVGVKSQAAQAQYEYLRLRNFQNDRHCKGFEWEFR